MYILPEQNGSDPVHVLMPRMRYLDPPAPEGYWDTVQLRGRWIFTTDKHTKENLTGTVVCYEMRNGEDQEGAAQAFNDRGLIALVTLARISSDYPGVGNWVRAWNPSRSSFPLFELTQKQNQTLKGWYQNQTNGIHVLITHDPNPWDKTFAIALPIVGISILLYSGFICIYAAWKLTLLVLANGFCLNMAQVTLWLNILGNLIRMLFGASDPFSSFGTTSFTFSQLLLTLSNPSTLSGALLISLYWHEMIESTGNKVHPFLHRLKWPFLISCIVMHAFELAVAIARATHYSFTVMLYIDGAMYVVAGLAVLIFFIVTRVRLQQVFNKLNKGLNSRRNERLSLATVQIQLMVIFMIIFIAFVVVMGAFDIVWQPVVLPSLWAGVFLSAQSICLCQVLLIRAPRVTARWFFCGIIDPESAQKPYETMSGTSSPRSPRSRGTPRIANETPRPSSASM